MGGLRQLTAALVGASVTPVSASQSVRMLSVNLIGVSSTSSSQSQSVRRLSASVAGTSTTPVATGVVTALRVLAASGPGYQ